MERWRGGCLGESRIFWQAAGYLRCGVGGAESRKQLGKIDCILKRLSQYSNAISLEATRPRANAKSFIPRLRCNMQREALKNQ